MRVSTYVYITNGYVAPIEKAETAMSVMVSGYKLFVNGAEVSGLMAGDDATIRLTLINNAKKDTSLKTLQRYRLPTQTGLRLPLAAAMRRM